MLTRVVGGEHQTDSLRGKGDACFNAPPSSFDANAHSEEGTTSPGSRLVLGRTVVEVEGHFSCDAAFFAIGARAKDGLTNKDKDSVALLGCARGTLK